MWPSQLLLRRLAIGYLMFCWMLSCLSLQAQDLKKGPPHGIERVTIIVDPLAPAMVSVGVTKDAVAREVEGLLQRHDFAITGTASDAQLTVTINAVEIKTRSGVTSGLAYTVAVSLEQEATLRGSNQTTLVTTWRRAGIGVATSMKAREAVRGQLVEYLEAFVASHHESID